MKRRKRKRYEKMLRLFKQVNKVNDPFSYYSYGLITRARRLQARHEKQGIKYWC